MSEHRLNPKPGEVWRHRTTSNRYLIHSVTDDGWLRYSVMLPSGVAMTPLWTQPTLDFIQKYRKLEDHGTV